MSIRLLLAVCVAWFVFGFAAARASAASVQGDNAPMFQAWADSMPIPTYPGTVTVVSQPGGATAECGSPSIGCAEVYYGGAAKIWIDPGPPALERQAFNHEMGHVFDFAMQRDDPYHSGILRSVFLAIWEQPASAYWFGPTSDNTGPYDEWFAEAYRMCAASAQTRAQINALDATYFARGYAYPGIEGGSFYYWPAGTIPEAPRRSAWYRRKQHMVCDLIRKVGLTAIFNPGTL